MSIDRLNYFKGEVLHAEDFQCEQNYHLDMRRKHNLHLHSPGIVYGLEVVAGINEVTIQPGMAIDKNGKEIIVETPQKKTITSTVDLGIKYKEADDAASDNTDTSFPGKKRLQETFELTTADPDAVFLAKINPSVSPVGLDLTQRAYSAPASNGSLKVGGDLTVKGKLTVEGETTIVSTEVMKGNVELGDADVDSIKVTGVLKTGHSSGSLKIASPLDVTGNILVSGKVDGRDVSTDGSNLDSHLTNVSNPHATTAVQIDGGANKIVAQINAGTGIINEARIDAAIARDAEVNARFDASTGHKHTGLAGDAPKIIHANLDQVYTANPASVDAITIKHVTDAQTKVWQDHVATAGNPHGTSAAQIGALPLAGGTISGNMTVQGTLGISSVNAVSPTLAFDKDGFFRTSIRTHLEHPNAPGVFQLGFSRGTGSAPNAAMTGDTIGIIEFAGWNGSSYMPGAWIAARARENFTAAASGTNLEFMTHPMGTNSNITRMVIMDNGNVGIGTTDPGADMLDVRGRCYSSGGWQTTNADYAEYFEAAGGQAIPIATPVVLADDGKIRPAKKGEVPIGIATENSAIIGNSYKEWPLKYLRDKFGMRIMEKVKEPVMVPKKQKMTRERQKTKNQVITEEVIHTEIVFERGKYLQKEKVEKVKREVAVPLFEEFDLYDKTGKTVIGKHRVPVMETYEEEVDVLDKDGQPVLVASGKYITAERPKLNPKFKEKNKYVPREERPEWICVGLLGQLPLRRGLPVAPTWVKMKDLADDVELWLVK